MKERVLLKESATQKLATENRRNGSVWNQSNQLLKYSGLLHPIKSSKDPQSGMADLPEQNPVGVKNSAEGHSTSPTESGATSTAVSPKKERVRKRQPKYRVVLWDDDEHSYDYVIHMMAHLFGFDIERGFQIAVAVDSQGYAHCLTTTLEHAELKREQIIQFGRDKLIASSRRGMRATIEPVENS